jgi:ferritin-like protein
LTAVEDTTVIEATPCPEPDDRGEDARSELVDRLIEVYCLELETLMNYLASSRNVDCDGSAGDDVSESLLEDAEECFARAQLVSARIRALDGIVPGSLALTASQHCVQHAATRSDLSLVLHAANKAEKDAIRRYERIVDLAADLDPDTASLASRALAEKRSSQRLFETFLREYGEPA